MLALKVANDNGNSEQDIYINNQTISSPNVYARVQAIPNLDRIPWENVLSDIHNNLIVSVDGGIYYIGSYALRSGQHCHSITVGVDNNKVNSDIVFVNTLAHIAGEALAIAYRDKPSTLADDVIKVTCDMATAIPVSYYSSEMAHKFEDKFTKKQHMITVYAGTREFSVLIAFSFVKCIPEGVTAAHAFLKNTALVTATGIAAAAVGNSRILHVAIGEGTTEFPLTTGIRFHPNFITGTNNGNGHAITSVLGRFKRKFGLQNITRQDFSRYVCDSDHKYHVDAMEFLMPALKDEAEDILNTAKQVISDANNEVDIVAVYGGGSILMKDYLKPALQLYCDRARINLLYIEDEHTAVFLEADGLNAFINSDLFDSLKKIQTK